MSSYHYHLAIYTHSNPPKSKTKPASDPYSTNNDIFSLLLHRNLNPAATLSVALPFVVTFPYASVSLTIVLLPEEPPKQPLSMLEEFRVLWKSGKEVEVAGAHYALVELYGFGVWAVGEVPYLVLRVAVFEWE